MSLQTVFDLWSQGEEGGGQGRRGSAGGWRKGRVDKGRAAIAGRGQGREWKTEGRAREAGREKG